MEIQPTQITLNWSKIIPYAIAIITTAILIFVLFKSCNKAPEAEVYPKLDSVLQVRNDSLINLIEIKIQEIDSIKFAYQKVFAKLSAQKIIDHYIYVREKEDLHNLKNDSLVNWLRKETE